MTDEILDPAHITETVDRLAQRVQVRFPDSGLLKVARRLQGVASHAADRAAWIERPILWLRILVGGFVLLIAAVLLSAVAQVRLPRGEVALGDVVQWVEAGVNDVIFLGLAILFLATLETRIKRSRALRAINELRSIAHIIDMHQLTKDPEWVLDRGRETGVVASRRKMSRFDLSRYLDYCSEMLSLTGKIAALYIRRFDDAVALAAVNELENLTGGLSRKVWQKLMILYSLEQSQPSPGPVDGGED
jgi:hypothetical protein